MGNLGLSKCRRAQSELLQTIILVGIAIVVGTAMLSYFSTLTAGYRSQSELMNVLDRELTDVYLNIISYDSSGTLWLLLKRFREPPVSYFIAVNSSSTSFLPCSRIYVYNPGRDSDGIMCNEPNECTQSTSFSYQEIYILTENGVAEYLSHSRLAGYPRLKPTICRIDAIQKSLDEITYVRVDVPEAVNAKTLLIFLSIPYGNNVYIFEVYEVKLS